MRAGARALREGALIARWLRGLPAFVRTPLSLDESAALVRHNLERRPEHLLTMIERGVFGAFRTPYRALFTHAGIELGDVVGLLRDHGVEGALQRLAEAGVYVTLEELKGRQPIRRGGLELPVAPEDFDNPLVRPVERAWTGGSRGPRRSVLVDLDHKLQQAVYQRLTIATLGLAGRPGAVWRPAPPGAAGLGIALTHAKLGSPLERWFSQTPLTPRGGQLRDYLFALSTVLAGRLLGRPLPMPEHVPLSDAVRVARWLAEKSGAGTPAHIATTASAAVRACLAAQEHGLDLAGTLFRVGGEPLTPAKARVVRDAGAEVFSNYTMTEAGRIGIPCTEPQATDDLHLCSDKLAVIQRPRALPAGGTVQAFLFTTLLPSCPKLMLNAETDDYGIVLERECGCLLGELGLTTHLQGVRSFEKLTSEGASFLASDLERLLDEELPARFGGSPTDYQLVEEEVGGLPRVSVVVSPRVGAVDERALLETIHAGLSGGPSYKGMMAAVWRGGDVLRVVRREPYETAGGKLLPLHVLGRERADAQSSPSASR